MAATVTGAEAVEWNLDDLYSGPDDPSFTGDLDRALADAKAFRERYHGKVADLDAAGLAEAIAESERIRVRHHARGDVRRAPLRGGHLRRDRAARSRSAPASSRPRSTPQLLFFDLEWVASTTRAPRSCSRDEALSHYANVLRAERRYRPHVLSEPEERIDTEKGVTGRERLGTPLRGAGRRPERRARRRPSPARRGARAPLAAPRARTTAAPSRRRSPPRLRPACGRARTSSTPILNERQIEDRLRDYPRWISSRNLSNEISDEAVDSLVEALTSRYDIPQRYYRLKARLLGLDTLYDYDRYAPLDAEPPTVSWDEARDTVLDAFGNFDPRAGEIVQRFFDGQWIDAAQRPGKVPGAFCATTIPDLHPYMLMNYAGERRSVLTLAHELGHGLHGVLAQPLGLLNARTPLTLAETASVFGEALTFERLLEREDDPKAPALAAHGAHRGRARHDVPADRDQSLRGRGPRGTRARTVSSGSSA